MSEVEANGGVSPTANGADYEHGKKRIVICCDGTWQDAFVSKNPGHYTNIIKLSRMVYHLDRQTRNRIPIPQVVFYQSGIGTEQPLLLELLQGATGSSLREKVQEAYGFICHNYHPGDEIFLFGFSRGAYTARMLAHFIGELGILEKKDLVYFASIFDWKQKQKHQDMQRKDDKKHQDRQGKDEERCDEESHKLFDSIIQAGKRRADPDGDDFTIKVLGVFDTVGSLGLPDEVRLFPKMEDFGLPGDQLGKYVEHAYQAIAINETRKDFNIVRFKQTEEGLQRKQTLKQVWFSGSHSDVGGGYCGHDLSDITLTWMTANVMDKLALDIEYMKGLFEPCGPWGELEPHDPATGIFVLAMQSNRQFPDVSPPSPSFPCFESIHQSVLEQQGKGIVPAVAALISSNPQIVCNLLPFEEDIRRYWADRVKELGEEGCEKHRRMAEEADTKKKTRMQGVKETLVGFLVTTVGFARRATLRQR